VLGGGATGMGVGCHLCALQPVFCRVCVCVCVLNGCGVEAATAAIREQCTFAADKCGGWQSGIT
jgi:hypothetical protein